MNQHFNGVSRGAEAIAKMIGESGGAECVYVAEVGATPCGFLCIRLDRSVAYEGPEAEITELYVDPSQRRRGIGRALMTAAMLFSRGQGASEIMVRTGTENRAARSLYAQFGFVDADEVVLRTLGA